MRVPTCDPSDLDRDWLKGNDGVNAGSGEFSGFFFSGARGRWWRGGGSSADGGVTREDGDAQVLARPRPLSFQRRLHQREPPRQRVTPDASHRRLGAPPDLCVTSARGPPVRLFIDPISLRRHRKTFRRLHFIF